MNAISSLGEGACMPNPQTLGSLAATTLFAFFLTVPAALAQPASPPAEQEDPAIAAVNKKYQAEYERLQRRGDELSKLSPDGAENAVGIDVDFSKWHDVSFDIPEFRMKRQRVVLDLPSVTMKLKTISWDNPETRMVRIKTGQYPEIHGWTVKWSNTYADVPQVTMVRKEIKLDLPEFRMNRSEIIFDVPEVFRTKRVSFRIPEITIRSTEEQTEKIKKGSEELSREAAQLSKNHQTELRAATLRSLLEKREALARSFEAGVTMMTDAIRHVQELGLDPRAVPQEGGAKLNLIAQLEELHLKFTTSIRELNAKIHEFQVTV